MSERGLRISPDPKRSVSGDHPFSDFDVSYSITGSATVGILEYPVSASVEVRRTEPDHSQITLRFIATNTVGEQGAWSKLGNQWMTDIADRLPEGSAVAGVEAELRTEAGCKRQIVALAASTFPSAVTVMEEGLPVVPPSCQAALVKALAAHAGGVNVVSGWIVDAYAAAGVEDRPRIADLARLVPTPSAALSAVLASEDARAAKDAADRTVAEMQSLTGAWKLTGMKAVAGFVGAMAEQMTLGADGTVGVKGTNPSGKAFWKSGTWEVDPAGTITLKIGSASDDSFLGLSKYQYEVREGFELALTDDSIAFSATYVRAK